MHLLWGILVGLILFIFGIPILRFINDKIGPSSDLTVGQACLVLIMIIICVIAFKKPPPERGGR